MLTLYPGGAMMFCESVAQFDENLKLPTSKKFTPLTESALESADVVLDTIQQLGPTYQSTVKPLMSLETSYDGTDEAVYKLEMVRNATSRITHLLLRVLTDLSSAAYTYTSKEQYNLTTFASQLGLFMKHAAEIKREGYTDWSYDIQVIRPFAQGWNTNEAIAAIVTDPVVLNGLVDRDVLSAIMRCSEMSEVFDGFIDMMDCLYTDHDRRIRLERRESRNISFETIVNRSDVYLCRENADDPVVRSFNRLMSQILRSTYQETYELLCAVMDNQLTPEWFERVFKTIVYRIVNLYGAGTLLAFTIAYQIRADQTQLVACNDYAARLMNDLHLNPQKPVQEPVYSAPVTTAVPD